MTPSANADSTCNSVRIGRSRKRQRLDALVLAVAAVGVGVEVAHKRSLRGSAGHRVERTFGIVLGQRKDKLPNPARLGQADGGSGGLAHRVDRGLCHLSEPDNQQPLGGETRRGVKEHRLVGASLIFPGLEHGCRCGLNRGIGGEQRGLGFGVRAFAVWVSAARTARSSVAIPDIGAKESSVRMVPILHGSLGLWQISACKDANRCTAAVSSRHRNRKCHISLN